MQHWLSSGHLYHYNSRFPIVKMILVYCLTRKNKIRLENTAFSVAQWAVSDAVVVVRAVWPGLWVQAIEWGRPPHVPGVIGPAYVVGGRCGRRSVADQVRKSGGGRRAEGVQGGVTASGPDGPAEGPGTARTPQNGLKTSRKRKMIIS